MTKPFNMEAEDKAEQVFLEKARDFCVVNNPEDKLAGVEYNIQHADGYARYMVFSSKPVKLLHLPLGDAWDSQWASKITKKDIEEDIQRRLKLKALFAKK